MFLRRLEKSNFGKIDFWFGVEKFVSQKSNNVFIVTLERSKICHMKKVLEKQRKLKRKKPFKIVTSLRNHEV